MESIIKDKTLIIKLEGKIDSMSSENIEKEINDVMNNESYEFNKLEIDARNLEYISSAGLRVFLKIAKKIELEITNASFDVYNVFEMTGFNQMIKVTKCLRKINTDNLEVIGRGAHGIVYKLDDETIVKVFTDNSTRESIDEERERSKKAFVKGVPTAISFDTVECSGGKLGVVYEMMGSSLSSYLNNHLDEMDYYAKEMSKLLHTLHSAQMDDEDKKDFKRVIDEYLFFAEKLDKYFDKDKVEEFKNLLKSIRFENTLVHGDFHPNNIMITGNELMIIDLADTHIDNKYFDFGAMYQDFLTVSDSEVMDRIGMSNENLKVLYDKIMYYYADGNEEEIKHNKEMAELFNLLKYATIPIRLEDQMDLYMDYMVKDLNEKVFDKIDELKEKFKNI